MALRKPAAILNSTGAARSIKTTMAMCQPAGPTPNLGPIATAPFYALRLYPSDIGTSAGLVTDDVARVLDSGNRPIAGLYACGNDMQSVMGGTYPDRDHARAGDAFAYLAASDATLRS